MRKIKYLLLFFLISAALQAQTYKSPYTGVYTTVDMSPGISGLKSKKTFMRLYVTENFNYELVGRLDIYKNKKGQELVKTVYWVGRPFISYRGGHSVSGHDLKGYDGANVQGKRGFSLGRASIKEADGGIELDLLGFEGVFQKESEDVTEIHPFYEEYLQSRIKRFLNGSVISVKYYNYSDGAFAFRMSQSELENALTKEELNVFYIMNIRGMRSMHSEYNSKEEYERSKGAVLEYADNAFATDWMNLKERINVKDLNHIFYYYPSLKRINISHPQSPEPQLILNVEKTQGAYRELKISVESEPIEEVMQQRFREADEDWQNERKEFLAKAKDPESWKRGRTLSKAYFEKEMKNRQRAVDGGYAYKSIDYWLFKTPTFFLGEGNGYSYSKQLKDIFDGNFGKQLIDWPVRRMYTAFVVYMYELYPDYLPSNAQEFDFSKTTTRTSENLYGVEQWRNSYTSTTKIMAHPLLAAKYREYLFYESSSGENIDKFGPISTNRYASLQHGLVYSILKEFKPGSAEFEQLFRNFKRYTNGQPSIQQEGLKLQSSKVAQDPLRLHPDEFLTQCMVDVGIENGDFDLCDCTHRKAVKLSTDQPGLYKQKYEGNYYAFFFDYIRGGGCK